MKSDYEYKREIEKLQRENALLHDKVFRLSNELDDYHQLKELLKRLVGLNG